ncbi:hypothetical protein [Amycolatopsis sp. NPDC051716]|uniref:hypothetical protein n=1 Tax=Amycolatopsis sp. NPDC051716 TaxID=3155804 RepID=UPI00344970CB
MSEFRLTREVVAVPSLLLMLAANGLEPSRAHPQLSSHRPRRHLIRRRALQRDQADDVVVRLKLQATLLPPPAYEASLATTADQQNRDQHWAVTDWDGKSMAHAAHHNDSTTKGFS